MPDFLSDEFHPNVLKGFTEHGITIDASVTVENPYKIKLTILSSRNDAAYGRNWTLQMQLHSRVCQPGPMQLQRDSRVHSTRPLRLLAEAELMAH
jgi:hypothetical protein